MTPGAPKIVLSALIVGGVLVSIACGGSDNSKNSSSSASAATSAPAATATRPATSPTTASAAAAPTTAAAAATTAPAGAANVTVKVGTANGTKVLVDSRGFTLYTSNRDTAGSGKSAVTGPVLQAWPALILASGTPTKGDGVTGDLTVITRDDGTKQVAYKGLPLYFWQNDKAPGDATGNGTGGFSFAT